MIQNLSRSFVEGDAAVEWRRELQGARRGDAAGVVTESAEGAGSHEKSWKANDFHNKESKINIFIEK